MADVFGRTTTFGGGMSADATSITFGGINTVGMIVQGVTINYEQNITRLYALEDGKAYYVAGRTQGQAEMQHVIGPAGLQTEFYSKYGNVCNVTGSLILGMAPGCGGAGGATSSITLGNPVINSLTVSITSQDMIINSGVRMMFSSLELTSTAATNESNSLSGFIGAAADAVRAGVSAVQAGLTG